MNDRIPATRRATSRPRLWFALAAAGVALPALAAAAPGQPLLRPLPPTPPAPPMTDVSDTLANMAQQHATRGQEHERQGAYLAALKEYEDAIAWLDPNLGKATSVVHENPNMYLVRASAQLDAARVLGRLPAGNLTGPASGPGRETRSTYLAKAEADFSAVLRIVAGNPGMPREQAVALTQKANLGRGYARLLAGDPVHARQDLRAVSALVNDPGPAGGTIKQAVARLDKGLGPDGGRRPRKAEALLALGISVVESFFPKYAGLAVAVGNVADAFKN